MEAYMTAPRFDSTCVKESLPQSQNFSASYKQHGKPTAFIAASETLNGGVKMSQTGLPWRASTYYGASSGNPTIPNASSMPEPMSGGYSLGQLDPVKVPPIFPAARNNLNTRYTPCDWSSSIQVNTLVGDQVRNGSSILRAEATRLCLELDDKTKRTQEDVGQKLGERVGNIEHWKGEVKAEIDAMIGENEALQEALRFLEKVNSDLQRPFLVAQECLYNREKRRGIDLVHDQVEKELIKEIDVLKRCQCEASNAIKQSAAQVALNRAAQNELEKDLDDKVVALNLDNNCHKMKNYTRGIKYHDGIHRIDNSTSVPVTWAQFSADNIKRSRSERSASRDLRVFIEGLCDRILSAAEDQKNRVNDALNERLKEYLNARNVIQQNLLKTLEEISEMEKVIELLKKSILEKEAPLQAAQTRLVTRVRRPNVEACRDQPHHELVSEVYEINESVDQLRAKLRQSENALQHLLKTKLALEHDLDIKNNSIMIDREKCLGIRLSPSVPIVGTTLHTYY